MVGFHGALLMEPPSSQSGTGRVIAIVNELNRAVDRIHPGQTAIHPALPWLSQHVKQSPPHPPGAATLPFVGAYASILPTLSVDELQL